MSIVFKWTDRQLQLIVEPGERLLDVCDDHPQTGTTFSCRSGHCGTCLVHVETGALLILPAATDERETLRAIGVTGGQRLACQIRAGTTSDIASGVVELTSAPVVRCEPAD